MRPLRFLLNNCHIDHRRAPSRRSVANPHRRGASVHALGPRLYDGSPVQVDPAGCSPARCCGQRARRQSSAQCATAMSWRHRGRKMASYQWDGRGCHPDTGTGSPRSPGDRCRRAARRDRRSRVHAACPGSLPRAFIASARCGYLQHDARCRPRNSGPRQSRRPGVPEQLRLPTAPRPVSPASVNQAD